MKKCLLLIGAAMMICACSPSKTAADGKNDTDQKPAAEKADAVKNDTAAKAAPEVKKADDKAVPDAKKADDKAAAAKIVKYRNFVLVSDGKTPDLKGMTKSLAADWIERALITGYEGPRTDDPWHIRIEGTVDIEGAKAYKMTAGQGGPDFKPVITGAVTDTRKIYLFESDKWMHFGDLSDDAVEPVEVK